MGERAGTPFPAGDPREPLRQLQLTGGCEYVSVVARDSLACGACAAVADRGYAAWDLPLLPLAACSRPGGCRCRYEPLITVVE